MWIIAQKGRTRSFISNFSSLHHRGVLPTKHFHCEPSVDQDGNISGNKGYTVPLDAHHSQAHHFYAVLLVKLVKVVFTCSDGVRRVGRN